VIAGTEGTISSYDYDDFVSVQTRKGKVAPIAAPAPKPPTRTRCNTFSIA
jgi:hypothetical protein